MCILFFPEGTRTKPGQVVPFKKGAFRLAIDLSLPVLPTTIEGTERLLPTETLDWRPGAVTLRITQKSAPPGFHPIRSIPFAIKLRLSRAAPPCREPQSRHQNCKHDRHARACSSNTAIFIIKTKSSVDLAD